jgi:hypothetical protein
MKIEFPHEKVVVTKLTDATLDSIITFFLLPKIKAGLKPKRMHDYDDWDYASRCIHDWNVLGEVHYFNVTAKKPPQLKYYDIYYDMAGSGVSDILNWMCDEGVIDSGEYLIEVVQPI